MNSFSCIQTEQDNGYCKNKCTFTKCDPMAGNCTSKIYCITGCQCQSTVEKTVRSYNQGKFERYLVDYLTNNKFISGSKNSTNHSGFDKSKNIMVIPKKKNAAYKKPQLETSVYKILKTFILNFDNKS